MLKTTVYLPENLREALGRAAAEAGRSEAELIREGVQLIVDQHTPPAPHTGVFASGDGSLSERVDELLQEGFGRTGSTGSANARR